MRIGGSKQSGLARFVFIALHIDWSMMIWVVMVVMNNIRKAST
jgi:hypothetical protein